MGNKKYEFTGEVGTLEIEGETIEVRRIRALKDIYPDWMENHQVCAGDYGGWIASEDNLSHEGECWVADEATVCQNAKVEGNALVSDGAYVGGNAIIREYTAVCDNSIVDGFAIIEGNTQVIHDAQVIGMVTVCDCSVASSVVLAITTDNEEAEDKSEKNTDRAFRIKIGNSSEQLCMVAESGGLKNVVKSMGNKKYEFTGEVRTLEIEGETIEVRRIRALKDINPPMIRAKVRAGDLGGWIASEDNLSHEGECWVTDEATVCQNAKVEGDALVRGKAYVGGNAIIRDSASVWDNSIVDGFVIIEGHAQAIRDAQVSGMVTVCDYVRLISSVISSAASAITTDNEEAEDESEKITNSDFRIKISGISGLFGDIVSLLDF